MLEQLRKIHINLSPLAHRCLRQTVANLDISIQRYVEALVHKDLGILVLAFSNEETLVFFDLLPDGTDGWTPIMQLYNETGELQGEVHYPPYQESWEEFIGPQWQETNLSALHASDSPNAEAIIHCLEYLQGVGTKKIDARATAPPTPKDAVLHGWYDLTRK